MVCREVARFSGVITGTAGFSLFFLALHRSDYFPPAVQSAILCAVCACVCLCERERGGGGSVCMCKKGRETERERMCVRSRERMCVCERERECVYVRV